MTSCKIQITHSLHSGVCKEENLTWNDICNMAIEPITLKTGQEAPLWSFYNMKGMRGEYGRLLGIAKNVSYVIAMQIDYDDGVTTINNFKEQFKDYAFILYTSKSHTDLLNKFRVIIPLKYPIDNKIYSTKSSRHYLKSIFVGCDNTTFDAWRKQRIPHKTSTTTSYIHHINHGKLYHLDINMLSDMYKKDQEQLSCNGNTYTNNLEIDPFNTKLKDIAHINKMIKLKEIYTDELLSINWAVRSGGQDIHYRTRKIIYSLRKNGMDDNDVFAYIMTYAPNIYQNEMHNMCFGGI